MKQTESEKRMKADPALDAMLEQMAEEVPLMPADFHDKWVNAVRKEARKMAPAAEKQPGRNRVTLVRWTRILSVAAVFVFLIGGTFLYRNTKQSRMTAFSVEKKEEAAMTAEEPAAGEAPAPERTEDAADAEKEVLGMDAGAPVLFASAAKNAPEAEGVMSTWTGGAYEEAEMMDMESANEEAVSDTAEEPAPAPLPTGMPTIAPSGPEEAEETPDLLRQTENFLTDMGDFLLAALPYLAVLAVPAVIALLLRRRKNSGADHQ